MEPKAGERYRHYRNHKEYVILGIGHHTETLEKMVTYQGLYEDPKFGKNPIWIRPYEMFVESVEIEGKTQPRFLLIV